MSNKEFFTAVRKITKGLDQRQVDSINGIMMNCIEQGVTDPVLQGYILGTGWHEARLRPIREVGRGKGKAYGKPKPPYGHIYYGRGIVQLTHDYNYEDSSEDAGVDLLQFPDKALDPNIAARLIVLGMMDGRFNGKGKGLAFYLGEGKKDYKNARRTVNITDRWKLIEGYALQFTAAIEAHGYTSEAAQQKPKENIMWSFITSIGARFLGGLFPGGKKAGQGTILTRILGLFGIGGAVAEKGTILNLEPLFGAGGSGVGAFDWSQILMAVLALLLGNAGVENVVKTAPKIEEKDKK